MEYTPSQKDSEKSAPPPLLPVTKTHAVSSISFLDFTPFTLEALHLSFVLKPWNH